MLHNCNKWRSKINVADRQKAMEGDSLLVILPPRHQLLGAPLDGYLFPDDALSCSTFHGRIPSSERQELVS